MVTTTVLHSPCQSPVLLAHLELLIEARNRKRIKRMAVANLSDSLLRGAHGDALLVPLFLTVPPHSRVKWIDSVLHSSGTLQTVGECCLCVHMMQSRHVTMLPCILD